MTRRGGFFLRDIKLSRWNALPRRHVLLVLISSRKVVKNHNSALGDVDFIQRNIFLFANVVFAHSYWVRLRRGSFSRSFRSCLNKWSSEKHNNKAAFLKLRRARNVRMTLTLTSLRLFLCFVFSTKHISHLRCDVIQQASLCNSALPVVVASGE